MLLALCRVWLLSYFLGTSALCHQSPSLSHPEPTRLISFSSLDVFLFYTPPLQHTMPKNRHLAVTNGWNIQRGFLQVLNTEHAVSQPGLILESIPALVEGRTRHKFLEVIDLVLTVRILTHGRQSVNQTCDHPIRGWQCYLCTTATPYQIQKWQVKEKVAQNKAMNDMFVGSSVDEIPCLIKTIQETYEKKQSPRCWKSLLLVLKISWFYDTYRKQDLWSWNQKIFITKRKAL